ncbi:MAG: sulfotransferase, partial [Promethearchaeota archaeon]
RSLYCGMQIEFLSRTLEHAKFVICVRDPLYQAQSILLGRKAIFGTYDAWFSLKPSQYSDLVKLSPFKQVAGQIYHILRTIGQGLKLLPASNYVIIDQEDLTRDPKGALDSILCLANLDELSEKEAPQGVFENRNKVKLDDGEWRNLKLAIEESFNDKSSSDILLS